MLTCAGCGTENEAGRKFCMECGQRLAEACPVCGTVNAAGAKFCGECGTALGGATDTAVIRAEPLAGVAASAAATGSRAGSIATPSGAPVAERRLVSVLFIDLVGFTTLSESRDAEDTRDMLSGYFDTAREIVDRHGGIIEKFIGDAVMAVWGTPTAHEDDAERAVRTALQLVEAVGQIEVGGQPLQARAGVLTGEAAVTIGATGQGMVAGDLVNTASRLQSAAAPGTVLVGESTYRAALHAIAFESAGEHQLKGKELPVPSWCALAVVARRGGSGRAAQLEPPFVGRDEELRTLREQFHATAREGKPRLVTIVGQAGIGKSRLGWELEKYLDGVVENIFWHEGRSPSYGEGISYWALAEMVRGRAGIAESEDPETSRHRLGEMLELFVPDSTERRWIEPRLTGLLGLDELPTESREELFAAWRTFFERMAQQATVLLVFWDLQWADQGLLDFIEHLLTWARSSPIFVLAEARPELFERRPGWGATVRSSTSIHLEPLSDTDMRLLLAGLVPGLPEHALKAIVARAEGVPLYAVETLRMLIDRGVLEAEADGAQYALVGELPELAVPESLHALLAARLDALLPEERALITDAAVLGLSFSVDALRSLGDVDPDAVAARLDSLVKRELLVLDVEPRSPERGQYHFVQGVVREVAYQSLAKRERRTKHVAAARYFESLGEEELAGVLASHYLAAYHATPAGPEADALAAQARVTLRAAADRAAALHAEIGALTYLEQAITVTQDPREEALLHERATTAAALGARIPSAVDHAQQAHRIYVSLGDRLGALRGRTAEAFAKLAEHGDRAAIAIMEEALAEVADLPPSSEIAFAQSELARALMIAGAPDAIAWADRVLAHPELVTPNVIVQTLNTKASAQLNRGFVTEAEVVLRGAIAVADRLGDKVAALRARNNLLGTLDSVNLEDVVQISRQMYEIAQRFAQRTWVQQALGQLLSNSFELGDWDAWIAEMHEEEPQASAFYRMWFQIEGARRMAYRGRPDEGVALVEASLASEVVRSSGQATASVVGTLGELRLVQGRPLDAFEAARRGWGNTDSAKAAIETALLAAAAARDADLLDEVLAALEGRFVADTPGEAAIRHMGVAFQALLAGRWDEGRLAYVVALRLLETTRNHLLRAQLQLAVGRLAGDRFREAADGAAQAEAWFAERGAESYVAAYPLSAPPPRPSAGPDSQVAAAKAARQRASS